MVAVMQLAQFNAAPDTARVAALYIRVSSGKQVDNWSVADQRALARLGTERGYQVVE